MKKYRHRILWRIAEKSNKIFLICEQDCWLPSELVEQNSDREEIKETKEFASDGLYLGMEINLHEESNFRLYFNTFENANKRDRKQQAYLTIRRRKQEISGDCEADNENWFYFVNYFYKERKLVMLYQPKAYNAWQICFSKKQEIPPEIEEAFLVYYWVK